MDVNVLPVLAHFTNWFSESHRLESQPATTTQSLVLSMFPYQVGFKPQGETKRNLAIPL